jgi:hypothetical protein
MEVLSKTDNRWTETEMVTDEDSETTDLQGMTDHHPLVVITEDPYLLDHQCRLPDTVPLHHTMVPGVVLEEDHHLPLHHHQRIQFNSYLMKSTERTDRSLSRRSLRG